MSRLKITWVRSGIGSKVRQLETLRSLGLRRLQQTVEHQDTPDVRGMVNRVQHLVEVEEVSR